MNILQLRMLIDDIQCYLSPEITPSVNARELLILTCATETNGGQYIRQIGIETEGVGGYGIFQIEIPTLDNLFDTLLRNKKYRALNDKLVSLMVRDTKVTDVIKYYSAKYNLGFQVAAARLNYYIYPEPMPDRTDIRAMAEYYMAVWRPGKGSVEKAKKDYIYYTYAKGV